MLIALQMAEDNYQEARRKDRAIRMQKRIIEARKGYRKTRY